MDQIEVNIKLATNNQVYNLPIRKTDTILKLKEYCKVLSKIPEDQQNLLYKGNILFDDKLISDYNIENNHDIILAKKGDQKPKNDSLNQNSNNFNGIENIFNINNMNFPNNKEVNNNEVANICSKVPDFFSNLKNVDVNLVDQFYQKMGLGSFSKLLGIEPQQLDEALKDPSIINMMNNMFKDPSLVEMVLNNPVLRTIQNNPYCKLGFLNPQMMFNPQNIQMSVNMFKKKENNSNESSNAGGIFQPPDPFGSLNNNQINKMMNSSEQIPSTNNNNIRNKENYSNREISSDYKEKYKEQLSQLKNMGFINEEANIQALKQSKGNVDNALDKLLK